MIRSALIKKSAQTELARNAVKDKADLTAFRQKPTPKLIFGIFLIVFSYVVCWPLVGALGIMAVYLEKPLIVVIGGPLAVGFSHLVFILGMALGGAEYTRIFLRWVARVMVEKYLPPGESA